MDAPPLSQPRPSAVQPAPPIVAGRVQAWDPSHDRNIPPDPPRLYGGDASRPVQRSRPCSRVGSPRRHACRVATRARDRWRAGGRYRSQRRWTIPLERARFLGRRRRPRHRSRWRRTRTRALASRYERRAGRALVRRGARRVGRDQHRRLCRRKRRDHPCGGRYAPHTRRRRPGRRAATRGWWPLCSRPRPADRKLPRTGRDPGTRRDAQGRQRLALRHLTIRARAMPAASLCPSPTSPTASMRRPWCTSATAPRPYASKG